ncbi:hypothetical protein ANCCEY_06453 [Ancylostoma ceylanicum]|uniref:Uncharacterized protein n=1 Tax=Ancylostoma ceylanicum TaxID=53326 RepID=A0A0D6LTC7_9BILA|nr:hypothetical protein ANCCEY_06453 [Ancylostoma ceylanicum]
MAKVEVQIRSCFCCGLSLATVFVALYTLILYSLLTGLAGWGLSDTANHGDASHYRSCELEAQGKLAAENRKLTFHGGHTTVVVEDSTTYHCSFGLYTEELKYEAGLRYTVLLVNIFLYVGIVLASILLLIGLSIYNQWLLVPWIILMGIDIIRGLISVLFIFIYSYVIFLDGVRKTIAASDKNTSYLWRRQSSRVNRKVKSGSDVDERRPRGVGMAPEEAREAPLSQFSRPCTHWMTFYLDSLEIPQAKIALAAREKQPMLTSKPRPSQREGETALAVKYEGIVLVRDDESRL